MSNPNIDPPVLPADAARRIAHLFRDALAANRPHELLALLQRYRAGERG